MLTFCLYETCFLIADNQNNITTLAWLKVIARHCQLKGSLQFQVHHNEPYINLLREWFSNFIFFKHRITWDCLQNANYQALPPGILIQLDQDRNQEFIFITTRQMFTDITLRNPGLEPLENKYLLKYIFFKYSFVVLSLSGIQNRE